MKFLIGFLFVLEVLTVVMAIKRKLIFALARSARIKKSILQKDKFSNLDGDSAAADGVKYLLLHFVINIVFIRCEKKEDRLNGCC